MLSENHPDEGWKDRLEEPGEWPASSLLNKEASWQQLRPRLHPVNSYHLLHWWWVAAVGLIIILSAGFHFLKQPAGMAKNITPAVFPPYIPSQPVDKKAILPPTGKVLPQPVKPATGAHVARRIPPARPTIISPVEFDKKDVAIATANLQTITPLTPPAITKQQVPIAVITATPKRKIRVVHINELGDGAQHLYPTAANDNFPAKRFPLFQGEVYRHAAPPVPASGINVFKSTPHTPN